MTSDRRAALQADIIAFIRHEVPRPRPADITPGTELERDLRLVWEDAEALLVKFFARFGVDHRQFRFDRYYAQPRYFLFNFGKRPQTQPLTVRMLVDAAERGAWPDNGSP